MSTRFLYEKNYQQYLFISNITNNIYIPRIHIYSSAALYRRSNALQLPFSGLVEYIVTRTKTEMQIKTKLTQK